MTLNRRSKVALGALGLALAALALDRWVLPAPKPTSASERALTDADGRSERRNRGGALDADGQWLARVSERIDAIRAASASGGHDAHALPSDPFGGAASLTESPAVHAQRKTESELEAVKRFQDEHSLAATILGPDPLALVGRRTLRVGDELDGFRLVRVESGWADFVSGDARVRLRVPAAGRNVRH